MTLDELDPEDAKVILKEVIERFLSMDSVENLGLEREIKSITDCWDIELPKEVH